MAKKTQITLHHCIQGWSGIAEWGGLPTAALIELVRPKPEARVAVFYSFGEGQFRRRPLLRQPPDREPHAPAEPAGLRDELRAPEPTARDAPRLRVENQLGFKMVKWIRAIEFVESVESIGKGEGGYNEDNEYFGELANI